MLNIIGQRILKKAGGLTLKGLKSFNYFQETSEYYFAYGANLDSKRFEKNNIPFIELGKACLENH